MEPRRRSCAYRMFGDAWGAAHSGFVLGHAVAAEGDPARHRSSLALSLRRFRELGDGHYALLAADGLAGVYDELGDRDRARALLEENLSRAREQSSRRIMAPSLHQLASHARDEEEGRALALDEAVALALDP